jgi:hypothetical protein
MPNYNLPPELQDLIAKFGQNPTQQSMGMQPPLPSGTAMGMQPPGTAMGQAPNSLPDQHGWITPSQAVNSPEELAKLKQLANALLTSDK